MCKRLLEKFLWPTDADAQPMLTGLVVAAAPLVKLSDHIPNWLKILGVDAAVVGGGVLLGVGVAKLVEALEDEGSDPET